jgi:hypothetical protein
MSSEAEPVAGDEGRAEGRDEPPPAGARQAPGRARTIGAVACGVLAVVGLILTTVAVWAQATVFDGAKVSGIVGDALAEPDVEAALAQYVTDQVLAAVDLEAAISGVLPTQLQRLTPTLVAGAGAALERGVTRLVATPEVQEIMTELVERAHRRAMRLLQGDGLLDGVSVVEGRVTVNLLPLVGRGVARLQQQGLLERLQLPELTADGDPAEQIAQLEASTGRDLPDDFGQLVVYESATLADRQESLERAQQTVALAKRATWLLPAITVAAAAACVLLARDRRRAALMLGLTVFAGMVVVRAAIHRATDDAPELAATPGGRAAIDAVLGGASTGLLRLTGAIMLVAAAVAVIMLIIRRFQRRDLIAAVAALAVAASFAVIGFSLVAVVVALVAAVLVPVVATRLA